MINRVRIGKFNNFYDNCVFSFGPQAQFQTGDHVILSYGVIVQVAVKITIGSDVQIGEYTSIRDTTHTYDTHGIMMKSPDVSAEIVIGNNVWIGRGCLISEGSIIEDGVVIAANSVVKGRLDKDHIYGGAPARMIKPRIHA